MGLRGIGIDLDHSGALPEPVAGKFLRCELGSGEVGDPALRAGEAGDRLAVHPLPHVPADLILRPHQARMGIGDMASAILERGGSARQITPQMPLRNPLGAGPGERGT
jgi:hypothetical protein